MVEYLSLPLMCCYRFSSLAYQGDHIFFDFPFLVVSLHSLSLVDPHHLFMLFHTNPGVQRQEAKVLGGDVAGSSPPP